MRSYNQLLGSEKNLELKQQPIRQETNTDKDFKISLLVNSILYFIDCVYILRSKGKHRLIVLHQNTVLHDQYYSSDAECKNAFEKLFQDKAWSEEITADWSHFYDPDKNWLAKKQKRLETRNTA